MNILLIMPTFYNYYKLICNEIEECGDKVFYFPDEIETSFIDRSARKLKVDLIDHKFDSYISTIVSRLSGIPVDRVILIFGGRYFKQNHILFLRRNFSKAKFIYYTWDSVSSFPGIKHFYREFDRYFSFDKDDCKKYDFQFHPLFYSRKPEIMETKYDYASVMTYGKEKADNYKKILQVLPAGLNGFQYLVMKHKSTYLYNRIRYPKSFRFVKGNISFKPISTAEVDRIFSESKAVIDCPIEGQNGLTMRTFEVLHANRKLITTNENIKTYDFYCPDNIFVVEKSDTVIPIDFFTQPFNTKFILSEKYSLKSFVRNIVYN